MQDVDSHEIDSLLIEVRAGTQGFAQDVAQMRSTIDSNLVDGFARAGNVLERGLLGAIRRGSLGFSDLKRIAFNTINEIAAQSVQNLFSGSSSGGIGGLLNFGGLFGSLLGLPGRATGGPVAPGRAYMVGESGPEVFVPASSGRIETIAVQTPASSAMPAEHTRLEAITRPAPAPPSARWPGHGGGGNAEWPGTLTQASVADVAAGLPGRATGGPVSPGRGYLVGETGPELFVPASSGRIDRIAEAYPQPGTQGGRFRSSPAERIASTPGQASRDVRVSISVLSPRGASVPRSLQRSTRQVASAVRRALAYN